MKNLNLIKNVLLGSVLTVAVVGGFSSCEDDKHGCKDSAALNYDPDAEEDCCCAYDPMTGGSSDAPTKDVGLDISSNTTWSKDTVYILSSRIKVRPGATLTIQAGTIIKGSQGQESNAKVLMVMRGAKIMAEGTATEPIIFTSTLDQIQPGQIASPNLGNAVQGLWGGLAILGNANISSGTADPTNSFDVDQIEGVPSSDQDGLYGGNVDTDNSGVLRYVSVRHGGTSIGSGNELNGISLGGVGSGTVMENIEVVANADDGLEFYGGTVSATNVLVWNNGDDALDTDQAWNGTVDNFILVGPAGSPLELDGPEGTYINGDHTIKNGTVVTTRGDGTAADGLINYDANTNVVLDNIHFRNVTSGQLVNNQNRTSRVCTITNITVDVPAGSTIADFISTADATVDAGVAAGTTGKANVSAFDGWSWGGTSGSLSGL